MPGPSVSRHTKLLALGSAGELAMMPSGLWHTSLFAPAVLGAADRPGYPPYRRGWLPPNQYRERITNFNNPNKATFPNASSAIRKGYRNRIGYETYVQFMLDHGRDTQPEGSQYVALSTESPFCRYHTEDTAGGSFQFPPGAQPMHAARRALIAAIQIVKDKNDMIPDQRQRDWVSVISFDRPNGSPNIEQSLTGDYQVAMEACTTLQATGDKGASTSTEAGLIAAQEHLAPRPEGGQGRRSTNKYVVLLTDGVPNTWVSSANEIGQYISNNPSPDFYGNGASWVDAPLMQAAKIRADNGYLYPVGLGLGANYGLMDRLARIGGTADAAGQSPRGSGDPTDYEQRMVDIFTEIIETPRVRLVQ
jgi:hypothetical protein